MSSPAGAAGPTPPQNVPDLMIADLVNQKQLGLRLVCGPAGWQSQRVSGAETIEVDQPGQRLEHDLIILTTGSRLRGNPDAQRGLVAELRRSGAAALVFGTGAAFKSVPRALLEEAQRLDLPVLEISQDVPIRDVVSFVYRSLGSDEARLFKRLTGIQRYLIDALGSDRPNETILRRLGRVCTATTAVVADNGVVAASATIPARAIIAYLHDRPPTLIEWSESGWRASAVPVDRPEGARWWLIAIRRGDINDGVLVRAALEAAAPLLTALGALGGAAVAQERAIRSAVLRSAMEATTRMDFRVVAHRAAAIGVDFQHPVRVALLVPSTETGHTATSSSNAVHDQIQRRLELNGVDFLSLRRPHDVVAVMQGDQQVLTKVLQELLADDPQLTIAISDAVDEIAHLPRIIREVGFVARSPGQESAGRLRSTSDVSLSALVLSQIDAEELQDRVRGLLQPILENPILDSALGAYFAYRFDIPKASESLHIHANTMRYRLERIEKMISGSLRDPLFVADLVLARMFHDQAAADRPEPHPPILPSKLPLHHAAVESGGDGSATDTSDRPSTTAFPGVAKPPQGRD